MDSSSQRPVGSTQQPSAVGSAATDPKPSTFERTLVDAERDHIRDVLRETNWVLGGPKGAAARLGMKRSTLYSKMKKLGLSRPEYAGPAAARRSIGAPVPAHLVGLANHLAASAQQVYRG